MEKNLDSKGRWRNKIVAFRVSPEEAEQIDACVRLSGLSKQDYITKRLTDREIVVQGNPVAEYPEIGCRDIVWIERGK